MEKSKNEKKPVLLKLLAVILIIAAGTAYFFADKGVFKNDNDSADTQAEEEAVIVETAPAVFREISDNITSIGSLMSNESVVITTEAAGKISGIFFSEGQQVKAGQILVRLDDSTLQASLDASETDRVLNEIKYKRAEALLKGDAVSAQERDEAYADWQRSEAQVRLVRSEISKTVIKAPFSGTAGLRRVSIGNYIQPGTEIVNLEDISTLKINFSIPQIEAHKITTSQKFSLKIDAYPDREFIGEIYAIDPKIDELSRSLSVRGILNNPDGLLKPGQFVQVTINVGEKRESIFVPEIAVIASSAGKSVFINDSSKAKQLTVTTGRRTTGWVEILSGLKEGDQVIVKGYDKVREGTLIQPVGSNE